jgi:hypothetical protein
MVNSVSNQEYLLSPAQQQALAKFCEAHNVAQADRDLLSRLTGRGYRPPITVEGWVQIYKVLKDAGSIPVDKGETAHE